MKLAFDEKTRLVELRNIAERKQAELKSILGNSAMGTYDATGWILLLLLFLGWGAYFAGSRLSARIPGAPHQ